MSLFGTIIIAVCHVTAYFYITVFKEVMVIFCVVIYRITIQIQGDGGSKNTLNIAVCEA